MNENSNAAASKQREVDVGELFYFIWKKIGFVIGAVMFGGIFAFLVSALLIDPTYVSTTKMYVLNHETDTSISVNDLQSGSQLAQDYMELVTSRPVLEKVIEKCNLDMQPDDLAKCINVTNPTDTRIIVVKVTTTDPELSQKIADCVRVYSAAQIKSVTDIDDVTTVETANYPEKKDGPSNGKNTVLGAVIGLLISFAALTIAFVFNDRIRSPEDVEKYIGLPVLAAIPDSTSSSSGTRRHRRNK